MANKFYVTGPERAAKVCDLFATVAPRYDLINDLQSLGLHRLWKRKLIRLAEVRPGQQALDLCCGTGDLARALARRGLRVVGLDFNSPMLAVAQRRLSSNAFLSAWLVRGDALQMPFPANCFDCVTVGYGLRNLSDLEQGLLEVQRVLRPGGRLMALDFGKPDNRLWRALGFAYLRWLVPLFGKLLCGDPATHAYIFESLQHYPGQHGLASQMRRLSYTRVRTFDLLGGLMSINYGEKAA